jgi:hypothetical protein
MNSARYLGSLAKCLPLPLTGLIPEISIDGETSASYSTAQSDSSVDTRLSNIGPYSQIRWQHIFTMTTFMDECHSHVALRRRR